MPSQIESERKEYYSQLEKAQGSDLVVTLWLSWFLSCLERALVAAESSTEAVLFKARLWDRVNHGQVNDR